MLNKGCRLSGRRALELLINYTRRWTARFFRRRNGYRNTTQVFVMRGTGHARMPCQARCWVTLSLCAFVCFFLFLHVASCFVVPRRDRVACGSCHFSRRERSACVRGVVFFALFVLLFSFAEQNERHRYCLFRSHPTTRRFWYCNASQTCVNVLNLTFFANQLYKCCNLYN